MHEQKGAMKAQSLVFRIEKCVNSDDKPNFCKEKEVIDSFVKDLTVMIWIIDTSIDLRYFHEESKTRHQHLIT